MDFKNFNGGAYTLDRRKSDAQNCLNLFPVINEATGEKSLARRPGMTLLSSDGVGCDRGMHVVKGDPDRVFQVVGDTLYEIDITGAKTSRGTLSTSAGNVTMADSGADGDELLIATGSGGYRLELSTNTFGAVAQMPSAATHVAFMNGRFVCNVGPTSRLFQWSGLYDGQTWDGGNVSGTTRRPDVILSLIVDNEQLILAGRQSVETWQNIDSAEVFIPVSGALMQKGVISPWAIGPGIDNTIPWLEGDEHGGRMIYKLGSGSQGVRISTFAVEAWLEDQSWPRLQAAESIVMQFMGHSFWLLRVPGTNTTWAYDFATGLWHEWTYTNGGVREGHRIHSHVFANGKHLAGDWENGNLFQLSKTVYTDNGAAIVCERTAPAGNNENKELFVSEFGLNLETGGADTVLYESDGATERAPQVSLLVSKDGGATFPVERPISMGKIGERNVRARWPQLGKSRDFIPRVRISDPVPFVIKGAFWEVEAGRS